MLFSPNHHGYSNPYSVVIDLVLSHLRSVEKNGAGLDGLDACIRHIFDDIYNKNPEHQTLEISKICFCKMVFNEMLWYYNRLAGVYLEIWVKDSNSSDWRGIRSRSHLFNSDCMYFTVHQFNDCCEKTPRIWHNVHLEERFKKHIFWNRMTSPFWGKILHRIDLPLRVVFQ